MTKSMTVVELSESYARCMSIRSSCKAVFKLALWWFALVYIGVLAALVLIGVAPLAKHFVFLEWFLIVNLIGLVPLCISYIAGQRNWEKIHPLYDEAMERRKSAKDDLGGDFTDTICISCGYALVGDAARSDICPECGKNPEEFS